MSSREYKSFKIPPRKCRWCGNEFLPTNHKNVFCTRRCGKKWHRAKKRGGIPYSAIKGASLAEIAKMAKAEGLSYGKYVAAVLAG